MSLGRAGSRRVAAAVLATAALAACANLLGIAATATNACLSCVADSCAAEMAACQADDGCAKLESCFLGCQGDYGCRVSCIEPYPINSSELPAIDACISRRCGAECQLLCGLPAAPAGGPDAANACAACIADHGCAQSRACYEDVECSALSLCLAACTTPDCSYSCEQGVDAAVVLTTALAATVGAPCMTACNIGAHWDCVGHVTEPLDPRPTAVLSATVAQLGTNTPLGGVVVQVCEPADPGCRQAPEAGVTDDAGFVTFVVPSGTTGFTGHLRFTGDGMMPALTYFDYPITAPSFAFTGVMFTPEDLAWDLSNTGVTLQPGRGVVLAIVTDCSQVYAANVEISATGIDDQTSIFYLRGLMLSADAGVTDGTGTALIVNVPLGPVTVRATPKALGRVSAQASISVDDDGGIAFVELYPN